MRCGIASTYLLYIQALALCACALSQRSSCSNFLAKTGRVCVQSNLSHPARLYFQTKPPHTHTPTQAHTHSHPAPVLAFAESTSRTSHVVFFEVVCCVRKDSEGYSHNNEDKHVREKRTRTNVAVGGIVCAEPCASGALYVWAFCGWRVVGMHVRLCLCVCVFVLVTR